MRITACHIEAFGQLRDREFADLDASVVVVQGPNETGKSSFFQFLQTMLYGIYPTDETKHPYTPRDGGRLEGSVTLEADDGSAYTVSRRLLSAPRGELARSAGGTTDLRNQTVPIVSHISKDVFEAVYALSLYDLTALSDQGAWQNIQDRLLGSLSIDFIRSARSVVSELEEEASSLWRPDRRGKPKSDEIRTRLKELRREARAAVERDTSARELNDQLTQCEHLLYELKETRIRLGAEKRRIDRLSPIREQLRRIEEARRAAGDMTDLKEIPDEPARRLDELRANLERIERERAELARREKEANERIEAVGASDRDLLEAKLEIAAWSKRIPAHLNRLEERRRAEAALIAARSRMGEKSEAVLATKWTDAFEGIVESLARAELRQRIDAFAEAEKRVESGRREQEARGDRLATRRNTHLSTAAAIVLFLGAVAAFAIDQSEIAAACLTAAVVAAWTANQARIHKREVAARRIRVALDRLKEERDARQVRVRELLKGLPIPEERLERPDPYLANDLLELKNAVYEKRAAEERCARLEEDIRHEREGIAAFLDRFSHLEDVTTHDPERIISGLEKDVDEAAERRRAAEAARDELDRIRAADSELDADRRRMEASLKAIEDRLRTVGGGDVDRGRGRVEERRKAHQRAQSYEEDLRKDVPDLDTARAEIKAFDEEGADWRLSDQEMTRVDHQLDELDVEINELTAARASARKELDHILESPTVDAIQSEQAQLDAELAELEARRDRLALLAGVIAAADRRFRAEHQPDVLRRAGEFLRSITGGRYDRLEYDEGTDTLRVFESAGQRGYDVGKPLSQGTCDQIYLAMRLAIVDHLDEGQERLPIFLDEVFVNWDEARRARCYEIFRAASSHRQVFIFTCHPWLANELAGSLRSKVVELEAETAAV